MIFPPIIFAPSRYYVADLAPHRTIIDAPILSVISPLFSRNEFGTFGREVVNSQSIDLAW